jgi:hypothetical protein
VRQISVNSATWRKIQSARQLLQQGLRVSLTTGDTVSFIWTTVSKRMPDYAYQTVMAHAFDKKRAHTIFMRDEVVAEEIRKTGKRTGATVADVVAAVVDVFVRASTGNDRSGVWAEVPVIKEQDGRVLLLKRTGLRRQLIREQEREIMSQRWQYMKDFEEKIKSKVDLRELCEKVAEVDLCTFPLEPLPYDSDPVVAPDQNPATRYKIRILRRGRGYQVFFLSAVGKGGGPDTVQHPKVPKIAGRPVVGAGTSYRMFDIYRNINWDSLTLEGSREN